MVVTSPIFVETIIVLLRITGPERCRLVVNQIISMFPSVSYLIESRTLSDRLIKHCLFLGLFFLWCTCICSSVLKNMITHNLTVFLKPDLCPKCIDKITLFFAMYAHDIPFHLLSDFLRAVTHITFMQHIVWH